MGEHMMLHGPLPSSYWTLEPRARRLDQAQIRPVKFRQCPSTCCALVLPAAAGTCTHDTIRSGEHGIDHLALVDGGAFGPALVLKDQ